MCSFEGKTLVMLDLALSILFSSLIFVVFKLFGTYKVQTLYAIIINYMVASAVGMAFYEKKIGLLQIPSKPWFLALWLWVYCSSLYLTLWRPLHKKAEYQ